MTTGADGYVIEGYQACRHCGVWKVDGTLRSGLCASCIRVGAGRLELVREIDRPPPKRASRSRQSVKLTDAQKARKRDWNRARSRALMRLSRIHHALYEVLLAEELAGAGLDPRLDDRAPGTAAFEREINRSAVG